MQELTHLSLFSGIGGLDLAAEWAGFHSVGQCEWADYPIKILEKHWPDVPRWRDICSLTKEDFRERTGLRTVDVISGGFPCQPFSTAGLRRGKSDNRYLWPEMLRVINELRPTWIVGENVVGIKNMALDDILTDLEAINYSTRAFVIPAASVGAPHRRDRIAILAHANRSGDTNIVQKACAVIDGWEDVLCEQSRDPGGDQQSKRVGSCQDWDHWNTEPRMGRVADGIPFQMDRLRCLGNAVVPQVFYWIFLSIAKIEKSLKR